MLDSNPRHSNKIYYLPPNLARMTRGFAEGKKVADPCRISDLERIFCWMRGFNQCLTGWANSGKSRTALYLMLVKSIVDDWKWAVWSPEEITSYKNEKGEIVRDAEIIYDILVHMFTGKAPYKEWKKRYNVEQMSLEEYMEAMDWVERHFFVIDTNDDDKPDTICDGIQQCFDVNGIDGYLIDPFKNVDLPNDTTTDRVMEKVFKKFERVNLQNDLVGNMVAHPKNIDEDRKRKKGKLDGPYRVVTSSFLLGGSAWENSMDAIYSYYRPESHLDPKSPKAHFYTFKMRDEERTAEKGEYDQIYFDYFKQRFYFNGICPITGDRRIPIQSEMEFKKPYEKKNTKVKENAAGYPEHWSNNSNDNMPF